MNEQGPWISPGPRPEPEGRRGRDAGWSSPVSRGGDGFRGDPGRRLDGRLVAGAAVLLIALISTAVALYVIRSRTAVWPPPNWIFAACDVGQGDALALSVGPAEAVVVDTGPDPAKADRCLRLLGVRKVPLLVLTHFFLGQFRTVS